VVQDADRKREVKNSFGQREPGQISLDDRHAGKPFAESLRLLDRRTEVDPDNPRTMLRRQQGIATPSATGVEHELPFQIASIDSRLDPKSCLVLLVPGHVIAVPLPPEAGDIPLAREPWDAVARRIRSPATGTAEFLTRLDRQGAIRTTQEFDQFQVHDNHHKPRKPPEERRAALRRPEDPAHNDDRRKDFPPELTEP
jgi:hypothetical protein